MVGGNWEHSGEKHHKIKDEKTTPATKVRLATAAAAAASAAAVRHCVIVKE